MFNVPDVLCLGPTLFSGLSLAVVVLIVFRMLLLTCVLTDLTLLMFLIDACVVLMLMSGKTVFGELWIDLAIPIGWAHAVT